VDDFKSPFGIPGTPVPRVNASDIKAMWKMCRDAEADAMARNPELKRGQLGIMVEPMKGVCSPEADVNAVFFRSSRLGILMMRCGKQDVRPPDILFSLFAKLPMKWWEVGVPHRALF
jgi:hypothetical protein